VSGRWQLVIKDDLSGEKTTTSMWHLMVVDSDEMNSYDRVLE